MLSCRDSNLKKVQEKTVFNKKEVISSQVKKNKKEIFDSYCSEDSVFIKLRDSIFEKLKRTETILDKFQIGQIEVVFFVSNTTDESYQEPIISLRTFFKGSAVDTLNVYETVKWEVNFNKRFCIFNNKIIIIRELTKGYETDSKGVDSFFSEKKVIKYTIAKSGKFQILDSIK